MHKFKSSQYLNNKRKAANFTSRKMLCINMKKDIFNYINLIRKEPLKVIEFFQEAQKSPNYNINFETKQIFDFINNLVEKKISYKPLIEKQELDQISFDLLDYLINVKKMEGIINYNNLEEEYLNFRMRAKQYGIIRGKYYEAIFLDSKSLLEIISYIMKDIKGRNILFNEKIKYIGIACGFFENLNNQKNILYNNIQNDKICIIINMVQDFKIHPPKLNNIINNNYFYYKSNKRGENKTPDIFTKIKTNFKNKNVDESSSINNKDLSFDKKIDKNLGLTKGDIYYELNKSTDRNNIVVNKSPLLKKKKYNKTSLTNFYLPKSNVNVTKPSFESFKAYVRNQKLSNLKKYFKGNNNIDINNKYKNNSLYFSSQYNFNKNEGTNKTNTDNLSEKNANSSFFSKSKSPRKKLNREEKIELLKKINKVSRDKSKKTQENLKGEEDSKSASFNTKKNISNDISFSEIISYENDKKLKNEKEIKAKLNNKIKNEIRKEMKKAKEEIKKELINKMILSSNRNVKKNIPNLKIPINNITNINETSYDFDNFEIINNTYTNPSIDGKYIDLKTNRSISSIDIFFPPNKRKSNDIIPGITNYNQMNNKYNNKDNYIVKKVVKLNGVVNKRDESNKPVSSNTSINRQKTNIYYKIPIINNKIYSYKNNDTLKKNNCFKDKNIKQRNNKIIKLDNNDNQDILNSKSNSPKRINIGTHLPFRKIIVKNNVQFGIKKNKFPCDKIIKIPKKIINYLDNNRIIINNKTNNIVYVKQISPIRNEDYVQTKY